MTDDFLEGIRSAFEPLGCLVTSRGNASLDMIGSGLPDLLLEWAHKIENGNAEQVPQALRALAESIRASLGVLEERRRREGR